MKTKKQVKSQLKLTAIILLSVFIGAIGMFITVEGKKMYKEVTEINVEVDNYFKDEAIREQKVLLVPIEEQKALPTTIEASRVAPEGVAKAPSPTSNKELLAQKGKEVFGESEVEPLLALVQRESNFRHTAQNPTSTAYGLFQFLDSTWKGLGAVKTTDPEKQIELGIKYIQKRYGTPSKAIAYHNQYNSY